MRTQPAEGNLFRRDDLDEVASAAKRPFHRKLLLVVVLSFSYCVSVFCNTTPARSSELETFLRKYLSQTGGYWHSFYRPIGLKTNWVVFSRPDKAMLRESAPSCYTLTGRGKRLTIYRYPYRKDGVALSLDQLSRQGQEIAYREFRAPISVEEENNLRFFSYDDKLRNLKYSRWLSFSEGPNRCGEVTVSLTQPRLSFLFNQQHEITNVTYDGLQHISLEDLKQPKDVKLLWRDCQNVCLEQQVRLSLADCREGQIAIQPPKKFWLMVVAARFKAFFVNGWAVLSLALFAASAALLGADRFLSASRPAKQSISHGISRFRKRTCNA